MTQLKAALFHLLGRTDAGRLGFDGTPGRGGETRRGSAQTSAL